MNVFRWHQCDEVPCMHTPRLEPVMMTIGGERLWLPLRFSDGRIGDAKGQTVAENVPDAFGNLILQAPYMVLAIEKLSAADLVTLWHARETAERCAERARREVGDRAKTKGVV